VTDPLPGGVFGRPTPETTGALRKWLERKRPEIPIKTAFVLAGGGSRGAGQVGMLKALTERGIRPDIVYGSSVGAVNASGFVANPTLAGLDRMARIWQELTSADVFPHGRVPAPWRFFQQREAVHPNDGLKHIIENGAGIETFEQALIPLEVVATSLTDGRAKWFTKGSLTEAVLASSALPSLLPPVHMDGEVLIDGGVVDNVPISRAIDAGCNRIFVLLCGPLHYTPSPPKRPIEMVLTAFFIAVHTRFARERETLPQGVEMLVFCVGSEAVSRYDDFTGTEALIETGKSNAEAVLDFWRSGGHGEIGVRAPRKPISEQIAANQGQHLDGTPEHERVPVPPA
jgi:NTE family protein